VLTRTVFVSLLLASFAASAQPSPGYIVTPSGTVIFPDAPQPAGDTSTLSGPGPNVSSGPEVGPGPEVGAGPTVGTSDQVTLLRQELADEEARRQDERAVQTARHTLTLQALDILRQAQASLATGASDGVDDELARAEAALSGRTRLDVEAAREALARSDLLPARQYLAAALAENRVRR